MPNIDLAAPPPQGGLGPVGWLVTQLWDIYLELPFLASFRIKRPCKGGREVERPSVIDFFFCRRMAFCFDDLGTGLALFWQTPITEEKGRREGGTVDRAVPLSICGRSQRRDGSHGSRSNKA